MMYTLKFKMVDPQLLGPLVSPGPYKTLCIAMYLQTNPKEYFRSLISPLNKKSVAFVK